MEVCSHVVQRRLACTQVLFLLLAPAIFLQLQFIGPSCVEAQSLVSGNASWALLLENAGIACMHMAVTYMGPVIFLDRTDIGPSQIALPNGRCRNDSQDQTDTYDCTAHSVMFDPATNTVRPLYIATDTWCSSGQFLPNGTMLQTGGYNDGVQKIRWLSPCPADGTCDWVESDTNVLQAGRWYATNQLLPDGSQFILGGQYSNAYEFVPANSAGLYNLELLSSQGYFDWYPFVHLLPDGNLYIFANRDSILFNYQTGVVLQSYPTIPGEPRNYPCAGSSVLLALDGDYTDAEVLVCGGASIMAPGNVSAQYPASQTCGQIVVTSPNASWAMFEMPIRRNMGDMVMLPTSDILIINGAQNGAQGWDAATNAAFNPVTFYPDTSTFVVEPATTIARVYHSTANLLPDGRILVAGSNCHLTYTFTGEFPTELRVEAFSPEYLDPVNDPVRPQITTAPEIVTYNSAFTVEISLATAPTGNIGLTLSSAPFTTHSYSQGQRQIKLPVTAPAPINGTNAYSVSAIGPISETVAPPSYYMLFAINNGVPSTGVWVNVQS
ncbi:hypothetical protein BDL97_03G020700 [Sphagnum fallax]|jgi:hypothetical protein|nr:hypothetical protein BDL97_03G020700 [Sphagnum fallax]